MAIPTEQGVEALNHLRSTEPPLWIAPSASLAETARAASQHLFSVLRPHAPKSPFDALLVNGFDAEQIWQQIDLQSQPLLSVLRRDIRKYEKNLEEIVEIGKYEKNPEGIAKTVKVVDDNDGMDVDSFYDDYEEDEVGEGEENSEGEETESEEREQGNGKGGEGIEDGFLKIKELEEFMVEDEAREYGLDTKKKEKNKKKKSDRGSDEEEEEEEKGKNKKRQDDTEEEEDDEVRPV